MHNDEEKFQAAYDFLKSEYGSRTGIRRHKYMVHRIIIDWIYNIRLKFLPIFNKQKLSVDRPKNVLLLTLVVPGREENSRVLIDQFRQTRHTLTVDSIPIGKRGKVENLNILLARNSLDDYDYVVLSDDDVTLSKGCTDNLIDICENYSFKIAQPAHKHYSYSSFYINVRHWGCAARQTNFVEVGPVAVFHRDTYSDVFPLPKSKFGWGIDCYWSMLAKTRSWRIGVVDGAPVRHYRPIGQLYETEAARIEAATYLAEKGFLSRQETFRTVEYLKARA